MFTLSGFVEDVPHCIFFGMTEPPTKLLKTSENQDISTEYEYVRSKVTEFLISRHLNPSTVVTIANVLKRIPCCARCILRFLGVREFQIYKQNEQEINTIFVNIIKSYNLPLSYIPESESFICSACLGTVQCASESLILDPLVTKLRSENYIVGSFNMNVIIPTSILVRHRSIMIHLERELIKEKANGFVKDPVDVKEPFKLILAWALVNDTGLKLNFENKDFIITVAMGHEESEDDHMFLTKIKNHPLEVRTQPMKPHKKEKAIYIGASREKITQAIRTCSDDEFTSYGMCPPAEVKTLSKLIFIDLKHASSYVGGRYLKFSRKLSQTPWEVGGVRLTERSVSEGIGDVLNKYWRADKYKFVSAGREDANVRMLGSGRPFYIELINPRNPRIANVNVKNIENEINALRPDEIQVRLLKQVHVGYTQNIKKGEEVKNKSYAALVWVSELVTPELLDKINVYRDVPFTINQMTPIRVLQRRAQMVRKKTLYSMHATLVSDTPPTSEAERHFLLVHLKTEAGTYIKEFIHGDLGRTKPSFGELLGMQADIMDLDVVEVDLEWPPEGDAMVNDPMSYSDTSIAAN